MPPKSTQGHGRRDDTGDAAGAPARPGTDSCEPPPFADVFEAAPQALALWRVLRDEHGEPVDLQICAINKVFREVFDAAKVAGQRLGEIYPRYREGVPDMLSAAARVSATGASEMFEFYHPLRKQWFECKVTAGPEGLVLSSTDDITERKTAESGLQRMRYTLDRMADFPVWSDSSGRIVGVSESACRQLEYTREELLGMTIFDISPDIDREKWVQNWADLKPGQFFRVEIPHRTKSGKSFPAEMTIHAMSFDGQDYHCAFCRDISDRKALEESLALTQLSVENAPDMIHWVDRDGHITYANRSMCEFLGYTLEELQTMNMWDISPQITPDSFNHRWIESADEAMYLAEEVWRTRDGREATVDISAVHVMQGGKEMGLAFVRDVTERKRAERSLKESEERYRELSQAQSQTLTALKERDEQLMQAQKMEAVGRLAGGIAHDFNNVLTTIIGYSDLLLGSPDLPDSPIAEDIAEIKEAAERAAELTQRILAFSRRQAMEPTVLSLNRVVSDTERLLARTLGADIELKTSLSPDLAQVEVDEQQFVQVLVNLAVNARDAMPDGGTLSLATANVELDEQFCKNNPEAKPGAYVRLTVKDTGSGMEEEVLTHVFEPFYTTKPPGLGTGLGLATAYGVVTQSGGCIYADSGLGEGTTITIYLPRVEAEPAASVAESGPEELDADRPGRTVVVVDSDATFRNLATRMLRRRGLNVMSFSDAGQATGILADAGQHVDALLTDTSLSGDTQGAQLASLATQGRPGLPVLFMTSQVGGIPEKMDQEAPNTAYLEKPFTAEELTAWVQTWLTDPGSADSPD